MFANTTRSLLVVLLLSAVSLDAMQGSRARSQTPAQMRQFRTKAQASTAGEGVVARLNRRVEELEAQAAAHQRQMQELEARHAEVLQQMSNEIASAGEIQSRLEQECEEERARRQRAEETFIALHNEMYGASAEQAMRMDTIAEEPAHVVAEQLVEPVEDRSRSRSRSPSPVRQRSPSPVSPVRYIPGVQAGWTTVGGQTFHCEENGLNTSFLYC